MVGIIPFDIESGQLLTSLQKGDEEAFAYVFKTFYPPLFNYAGRILRDEEQANDVVQDTFCRLYENRSNITIHISLKSYLYRSVYNNCIDLIRHKKVANAYVDAKMLDFYFSRIIQLPEAELKMLDEDIGEAIREAIAHLPERCRQIFCLSKLEGLSNKQIAEQLGISVKTVETQMTTAFVRLRKELEWLLFIIISLNS